MSKTHDDIINDVAGIGAPAKPELAVTPAATTDTTGTSTAAPKVAKVASEPAEDLDAKPAKGTEPATDTVPVGTLAKERARRREAQEELRVTRERMSRMEGAFDEFRKRGPAGKETPEAEPDWDTDPVAAARTVSERQAARLQRIEQALTGRVQQDRQTEQRQGLVRAYHAAAESFAAKTPDFKDAYRHLITDRQEELEELGYTDPAVRNQILEAEEMGIVQMALSQGANPAERLYAQAKRRGYKAAVGNDESKLDTLAAGAKVAKSLAGAGAASEGGASLARLADLMATDPAAGDRLWEQMRRAGMLG